MSGCFEICINEIGLDFCPFTIESRSFKNADISSGHQLQPLLSKLNSEQGCVHAEKIIVNLVSRGALFVSLRSPSQNESVHACYYSKHLGCPTHNVVLVNQTHGTSFVQQIPQI